MGTPGFLYAGEVPQGTGVQRPPFVQRHAGGGKEGQTRVNERGRHWGRYGGTRILVGLKQRGQGGNREGGKKGGDARIEKRVGMPDLAHTGPCQNNIEPGSAGLKGTASWSRAHLHT